jgi:hypothetical protein
MPQASGESAQAVGQGILAQKRADDRQEQGSAWIGDRADDAGQFDADDEASIAG